MSESTYATSFNDAEAIKQVFGEEAAIENDVPEASAPPVADQQAESPPAQPVEAEESEKHERGGVDRKIRRAHREARELEETVARQSELLNKALEALSSKAAPPSPPAAPQQEGKKPELGEFETYEQYSEALADWVADRKVKAAIENIAKINAEQEARKSAESAVQSYRERLESIRDTYDDFDEVVGNHDIPISAAERQAIITDENGPAVAYYLGKHPEEAAKIASMDAIGGASAIGKISARLSHKTRTVSKAPAPGAEVGAQASSVPDIDPNKMSFKEFKRAREKGLL